MYKETKSMPAFTLIDQYEREKIKVNDEYQRDYTWRPKQKKLLIDSIVQEMDIPKIYLREVAKDEWEVVDGQQRLRTIVEFSDNKFALSDKCKNKELQGKKYEDFDEDQKSNYDTYQFDVVYLKDASEDEIRDMFRRLQSGDRLNSAEQRNSMSGDMRKFVRGLSRMDFFKSCKFNNKRLSHDHVAAQMTLLELAGQPANATNRELERMYEARVDFKDTSAEARNVRKILGMLHKVFPEKIPELDKANAVSLFLLFRELDKKFIIKDRLSDIRHWYLEVFGDELRKTEDPKFVEYKIYRKTSTDKKQAIKGRHDFLMTKLLEHITDLTPRDTERRFSNYERDEIWRRDNGKCQLRIKCKGQELNWDDNWHADHKVPHEKGGKTTIENGQVSCPQCNQAKKDRLL